MYPCTIVAARYQGVYEGGRWLAFFLDPEHLPPDYAASDVPCATWWGTSEASGVGRGATPEEALEDLRSKEQVLQWRREGWTGDSHLALAEWPEFVAGRL